MKKPWILILSAMVVFAVACGGEDDPGEALEAATKDLKESGQNLAGEVENVVDDAGEVLKGTIDEIKAALAEKEDELQAIKDKLADLSPADLAGEDAAKLKEQSDDLMKEIKGLKDKLEAALNG